MKRSAWKRAKLFFGFISMITIAAAPAIGAMADHPEHPEGSEHPGGGALGTPFSVDAGVDVLSAYFFRGIHQEDSELIAQPWIELGTTVLESIDATLGFWNSLHSERTGTNRNGWSYWYEADVYAGLSTDVGENWNLGVTYTWYNSPNSAFLDVQELALGIKFDDSSCWEAAGVSIPGFSGLGPSATIAFETNGAADGRRQGTYLELAIEPAMTPTAGSPVTVSFPTTLGLSIEDYYESPNAASDGSDESFGYLETGVKLTYPVDDNWDVYGGVHAMFLGSTAREFNDGDDVGFEIIGKFGVSISF